MKRFSLFKGVIHVSLVYLWNALYMKCFDIQQAQPYLSSQINTDFNIFHPCDVLFTRHVCIKSLSTSSHNTPCRLPVVFDAPPINRTWRCSSQWQAGLRAHFDYYALTPGNGYHFAHDDMQVHFITEAFSFRYIFHFSMFPKSSSANKSEFVWPPQVTNNNLNQCWRNSMMPDGITVS